MKRILLFLCFFTFVVKVKSQTNKTQQIEKHIKLSKTYLLKNLDSSFFHAEKAISLANTTQLDTLISKAAIQKSSVFIFKNRFQQADSILNGLLKKKLPPHIKGQVWHNLATIQYKQQALEKALELYIKAAKTTEQSKHKKPLLNTYANIGVINARLNNFSIAQKYLEKAVALADFNQPLKLQILVNLSNIYKVQKQFLKFEESIFEAEKIANKYKINRFLAIIYTNLSDYYAKDKGNYTKAIFYGKKGLNLKKQSASKSSLSLSYNNIAHSYLLNKKYQQAIYYLDSALPNAKGRLKSYIYNNYKTAYSKLNNYKKALHYANLKDRIKDSLHNKKQKETITEITEKYESEKKEQQIDLLHAENALKSHKIQNQQYLLLAAIFGFILLTALVILWFRNQKTKATLEKASLQYKFLQTQLNPHFLFHSLNSIQSFIYLNKKEASLTYIKNYSELMRFIFDASTTNFISVKEDAEAMQAYLKLQQANFSSDIHFSLEFDESISNCIIPPMFIQPYIENAIQHGIKQVENGMVTVHYKNAKDCIEVLVFDNGNGFETKNNNRLLEKNSSLAVIQNRIKNLYKTYKYPIQEKITSTEKGTSILLTFPKKYHY